MPYLLSRAADDDIAAIALYTIDNFGIEQAVAYRDGLIQTLEFLAEHPQAARERMEIRQRSRVFRYKSHLIVYRIKGDGIFIQRIRHGREDWLSDDDAGDETVANS